MEETKLYTVRFYSLNRETNCFDNLVEEAILTKSDANLRGMALHWAVEIVSEA